MTELHTNNIFRQQQQLPPIMSTTATTSTPNNTNAESFHNNNSMMEEDTNRRSLSHPYPTTTNASSSSSQWINNNNTNNHASTGYSPRDSCDMSYDGEDYHHNHGQPTPSPSASTERSRSKKHRTPSTRDIHVEKNTEGKPPYSYATLIKYAIENSLRKKLTLAEIYQWVIEHYPYYGSAGTGWKNSIRHNLSLNKSFVRVPRPINEPGKGSYWQVDYRAAEAELRSKTTMAVRGRANRSGSDPYRPDSSWAALNATQPSSNNTRFTRDSRSLSMDSNMNTSTKQPNTPTSTGFPTSSSSSSSGIGGYSSNGYYGNSGYGYNAQTPQQQQQQTRHHMNRHSADYSRSPYMYDMYANQPPPTAAPVDVQQHGYQQHQQQQQQHHHHHNHNHHNAAAAAAVHNRMPNSMYDGGQPPYGHPMYPSYTYGGPVMTTENKEPPSQPEEQQGSFSTPQPHYRRVNSPKAEPYHSPSPPQPTDTKRVKSKPSVAVNGNNNHEYDWIA